jgi:hypothetical protein
MLDLLQTLQDSSYALWVKESSTTYVAILAFHTIGLAFLVGISGATAMRILGVAKAMPLGPLKDFFPLMYAGAWINVATGVLLLTLYPFDYAKNPIIYIKLAFIGVAIVVLRKLRAIVFDSGVEPDTAANNSQARALSWLLLIAWIVATFCGRVVAYQWATRIETAFAVLVFFVVAGIVGALLARVFGKATTA